MEPILDRDLSRPAGNRPRISIILVTLLILVSASFAFAFTAETALPRILSTTSAADVVTIDTATVLGAFAERIREFLAGLSFSPTGRAEPASNPQPGNEPRSRSAQLAAAAVQPRSFLTAAGAANIERGAADLSKRASVAAAAAFDAPTAFSGFLRSLFSRFLPDRDLVYVAPPQPEQTSQAKPAAAPTTVQQTVINQPVIERVVETERV